MSNTLSTLERKADEIGKKIVECETILFVILNNF